MTNNNRPPIPAELRRRVLLEAGHRCAIPTCKFPDIDVHHIVPWTKCREHQFDNLIALCPNCHRRAHLGEIDRKSLVIYKSRLIALFGQEMLNQPVIESNSKIWVSSLPCNYTAAIYSDISEEYNYSIEIEFPRFEVVNEINDLIESKFAEIAKDFVKYSKDPQRYCDLQYYIKGSCHIGLNTPLILSLRCELTSYAGGAHGADWTEVFNLRLDQLVELHIEDLFNVPRLGVKALSDYSIEAIIKLQPFRKAENVKSGAGPESKNFTEFNLTSKGILLSFREYQLGCYAEGIAEILVPYSAIRPFASDVLEKLLTNYGEIENT